MSETPKEVFEGFLRILFREDSGQCLVCEVEDEEEIDEEDDPEDGIFVRVHSWSDQTLDREPDHGRVERFIDKKVRITLEVIEEEQGDGQILPD